MAGETEGRKTRPVCIAVTVAKSDSETVVFILSIIAIVVTSLIAFRQTDIKKLIDTSVAQTREGTDLVRTAGDSMQEIVTAVARVSDVLAEIKELNAAYEERFGHVYLVFANGRPAAELLDILKQRMSNDPETERRVMRMELAKINRSRLIRMLTPASIYLDEEAQA